MSSARDLLLHQSVDHLLAARYTVEGAFLDSSPAKLDANSGRELGFYFFGAINELLKITLDMGDMDTFSNVERAWARMFDDVWMPSFPREGLADTWSDRRGGEIPPELIALLRRREILRMGLIMWTGHLIEQSSSADRRRDLGTAMNVLISRLESLEWALDAFDAAQAEEPSMPWSRWFLTELPTEEAHYVPTSPKLLWAAILIATRSITTDSPAELRPREWFAWRQQEVASAIERLDRERQPWQEVLGLIGPFEAPSGDLASTPEDSWRTRLSRLRVLFERGAEAWREEEALAVRIAPLDPERVKEVRERTISEAAQARLIRDTVEKHSRLVHRASRPSDYVGLVSRSWLPRSFFVPDSRVVGLGMIAHDLARPMRDAERQELLAALPDSDGEVSTTETITGQLRQTIAEMRAAGLTPTLLLLPHNWRLQQAIGLTALGGTPVDHDLVPLGHSRDFCGVLDDVLALGLVGMPDDRIWVMDVAASIEFEEWPSERNSGLEFELLSFDDAEEAQRFLEAHPEVAGNEPPEKAIVTLQDRVLITLKLCWRIRPRDKTGARAVQVPAELREQAVFDT